MTIKVPTFCGWNVEVSSQQWVAQMFYCNLSSLNGITCFCQVNTNHPILLKYRTAGQYKSCLSVRTGYERFLNFYMQLSASSFLDSVAVIKSRSTFEEHPGKGLC